MHTITNVLADVKTFKAYLEAMGESVDTCNDLHEYVTGVIRYLITNYPQENILDPAHNQLKDELANINPSRQYKANSAKSQSTFRNCKTQFLIIIDNLIASIERVL